MTVLRAGAATDVGRVREINEDRYLCGDTLFAVADGVGGHQAGEVAAQTSVDTLSQAFSKPSTESLLTAVERANQAVWRLAQGSAEKRGMGTTITAVALVVDQGDELLAVVNVGDSRAYLLQQGELLQLTEDHSLVEEMVRQGKLTPAEAHVHPQRSIITRALGMEPHVQVDSWELTPYVGDRLLLCSDGLTNELSDAQIGAILRQLGDPKEAARELTRAARSSGGADNITAVVIDVVDDDGRSASASAAVASEAQSRRPSAVSGGSSAGGEPVFAASASPPFRGREAGTSPIPGRATGRSTRTFSWRTALFVALVFGVVGVAGLAVYRSARGTYYVGLQGARVAIFRGRPGGLLWFQPTLVDQKSLSVEEVPGIYRKAVTDGHQVASKADADRYVTRIRQDIDQARATTTTTAPPAPPDTGSPVLGGTPGGTVSGTPGGTPVTPPR